MPGTPELTAEEIARRLMEGDPPIAILAEGSERSGLPCGHCKTTSTNIVADRLHSLLRC